MNCPRYVHRFKKVEASRYAPGVEAATPFREWKRIDNFQDVIRPADREAVKDDTVTEEDWIGRCGDKVA